MRYEVSGFAGAPLSSDVVEMRRSRSASSGDQTSHSCRLLHQLGENWCHECQRLAFATRPGWGNQS